MQKGWIDLIKILMQFQCRQNMHNFPNFSLCMISKRFTIYPFSIQFSGLWLDEEVKPKWEKIECKKKNYYYFKINSSIQHKIIMKDAEENKENAHVSLKIHFSSIYYTKIREKRTGEREKRLPKIVAIVIIVLLLMLWQWHKYIRYYARASA